MEKFDIRDGSLVNYLGEEADVIIPDGVTDISSFAFKHTPQLRRVSIPGSVRRIYERTFDNCPLLREVSLGEGAEIIGDYVFLRCSSLLRVHLPQSLRRISRYAFSSCWRLRTIRLPQGLTSIGERAFQGCGHLRRVSLPQSLQSIGEYAFLYCTSLQELVLPENTTEICDDLFEEVRLTAPGVPLTSLHSAEARSLALLRFFQIREEGRACPFHSSYSDFLQHPHQEQRELAVLEPDLLPYLMDGRLLDPGDVCAILPEFETELRILLLDYLHQSFPGGYEFPDLPETGGPLL